MNKSEITEFKTLQTNIETVRTDGIKTLQENGVEIDNNASIENVINSFKEKIQGGEKISLLEYMEILSKGFYDSSSLDGVIYVILQDSWSVLRYSSYFRAEIGNLSLSRENGLVAQKFGFVGSFAVTQASNSGGFVFPNIQGSYYNNSGWLWNYSEKEKHKFKILFTKPFYKIPPALENIWICNEEFNFELPLKIKFNDYFALGNKDDVTGIFALKFYGTPQFLFMLNGKFPIFDYSQDIINYGSSYSYKFIDLNSYVENSNTYNYKQTLNLPSASSSSYTKNLKSQVDLSTVYFNSEDILDENGNVVLPKNCDITDFI